LSNYLYPSAIHEAILILSNARNWKARILTVILGNPAGGKTCLINGFLDIPFNESEASTIGAQMVEWSHPSFDGGDLLFQFRDIPDDEAILSEQIKMSDGFTEEGQLRIVKATRFEEVRSMSGIIHWQPKASTLLLVPLSIGLFPCNKLLMSLLKNSEFVNDTHSKPRCWYVVFSNTMCRKCRLSELFRLRKYGVLGNRCRHDMKTSAVTTAGAVNGDRWRSVNHQGDSENFKFGDS
jgi:hypothetical protein